MALNYAVSEDTALGVVIGRYAESVEAEHELASSSSTVTSDAVAVYLSHKMGGSTCSAGSSWATTGTRRATTTS